MKIRRWSAAGLVAVSLLLPGVAGCGSDGSATPRASSPADPRQVLLASTKGIEEGNYRFTAALHEGSASGSINTPGRGAQIAIRFGGEADDAAMEIEIVYLDSEAWVKTKIGAGLDGIPGFDKLVWDGYYHVDAAKADVVKEMHDGDPVGADLLLQAMADVEKTADSAYQGTIDLSKATDALITDEVLVKAMGAQAQKLPFQARLDAQGRLAELTVQMPTFRDTPAHELKLTYSDYGAAAVPSRPAADKVKEAPSEIYEYLN